MENMRFLFASALFAGCMGTACAADTPQVAGCPAIAVPTDVLIIEGGGPFPPTLISPSTIDNEYSGCTYAWFKDGSEDLLISTARFEHGQAVVASDSMIRSLSPRICLLTAERTKNDPQCASLVQFWKFAYDAEFIKKIQDRIQQEKLR